MRAVRSPEAEVSGEYDVRDIGRMLLAHGSHGQLRHQLPNVRIVQVRRDGRLDADRLRRFMRAAGVGGEL